MRNPKARLHRPVEALRRLQGLIGQARGAYWNDRAPDRAERVVEPLNEAEETVLAALSGGPLPRGPR